MTEPTPLHPRRRYTRRQKVTAVMAATMSTAAAAAEQTGVPESTVRYWLDQPEFVELRAKTREDQAEAARALGLKVLGEIERRLPSFEPRDLSVLYGILTDKGQLLAGEATSRTESRELLSSFDDGEREAATEWLLKVARERLSVTD